ncbi:bestrophin family protein [Chryseobacterium fistulae]|jgi:putative membrane protein|uniref:Bestrophin n=1 Tax=Chryseobacterium fistulae TaxID=2675058 RepID=A0A6N4XX03_9FLAO|nr:bestrophin family ion channel [Chryseobacterium fistulae]CAA7388893.1 hypothetical protein CHRY9393_02034 [Chryseobacterium fistulae]
MLLNRKISILYFVNNIKWQILFVITFALAVGFLHLRPEFKGIDIPLNILTLLGTIVTILLAFRTSQSYERWWEARTIWGAIVNDSRTLTRTVLQFLPENESVEKKKFAERQIIFVNALGETLRKVPLSPKVEAYVKFHNINAVNLPNALLDEHSHQIGQLKTEGKISDFQQLQLNDIVSRLCDSMGKCERIKNTVFPRSYSLILHILIYAFTAILPFSLNHNQFVTEIAISIIIPLLFIAVEKTAIIMQDPFENSPVDTPMTSIAQTIEINILQMMGEKDVPAKEDKGLYYEM